MFIDIPRENGQMCPMSKRIVNGMMHGAREVEETPIQACGRIEPAVILHTKVHIRQMHSRSAIPGSPLSDAGRATDHTCRHEAYRARRIMRMDSCGVNSPPHLMGLVHHQRGLPSWVWLS